ncbi:FtsX-like permease family protein [Streptomyces gamaensis]|uniref:FtsX-like permease family protein n=1 Tax=Streptomyces gamaensis TaxID=1763542 RepID=A0ABW0Z102_9ACTN
MISIALQTLRNRWGLFLGSLIALSLGVALIASTGEVLNATRAPGKPSGPGRYDAAAAVVRAPQSFTVDFGSGDGKYDQRQAATRPHRLDDARAVADAVRAVPGVERVVVDRSLPAQVITATSDSSGERPVGHGWSSAALAPYRLTEGKEPAADDEVVLASGLAGHVKARVGDAVSVVTPEGRKQMRVAGIAAPPQGRSLGEATVFFTDEAARRLSGDAGRADAVGVLARPGTAPGALAEQLRAALPDKSLKVGTGSAKGGDPQAAARAASLSDVATLLAIMAVIAGFVSVFVVSGTFAFAIAQRRRELALLRTVGATPQQVRRMIMAESAALGVVASAVGCALGVAGGRFLASVLVGFGMAPEGFAVEPSAAILVGSFFTGVVVALLGVFAASRRAAKVRPAESLRDAALETGVMTRGRWITGSLFLAAAVLLIMMMMGAGGDGAVVIALVLTEILVVAMVAFAPLLVPPLVRLATLPLAAVTSVTGMLAGENARSAVRRTAGAAAPILVTVAVSGSLIGVTNASSATQIADSRKHLTADVVVAGPGAGMPASAVRELAGVRGVASVTPVSEASGFLVGSSYVMSSAVGGVAPEKLGSAFKLDPVKGSLDDLKGDSLAVTSLIAGQLGWRTGSEVEVYLADATKVRLKVAAVLKSSASLPPVILPQATLAAHQPGTMSSAAYLSLAPGADRAAVTAAADKVAQQYGAQAVARGAWLEQRAEATQQEGQVLMLVLLGMAMLYTGIAIANTLVMAAGERAEGIALMRKIGATRAQILRTVVWETLTVVVVGGVLGLLADGVTMMGMSRALSSSGEGAQFPVPWLELGSVLLACLVVALLATVLPTLHQLRGLAAPARRGSDGPKPVPAGV